MITTHILDVALGRPAARVPVALARQDGPDWVVVGSGLTDADGRLRTLGPTELPVGTYRIRFDTGAYFASLDQEGFYPYVEVVFTVHAGSHYHVPLLLSPYGYSTYRGS